MEAVKWGLCLTFLLALKPSAVRAFSLSPGEESYGKQDYQKAEEYFGEKARKSPDQAESAYDWGNTLYRLGKYDEAGNAYQQALQKKPDLEHGWYNLGNALFQQQRYRDAIEAYDKALGLSKDPDAEFNKALAEKMLKKNPKSDKSKKKDKEDNKKKSESGEKKENKQDSQQQQAQKKNSNQPSGSKSRESEKKDQASGDKGQQTPNQKDETRGTGGNQPQKSGDEKRREEAKKNLGLTDRQVQEILDRSKRIERKYQAYFSRDPKRDWKNQNKEFMQKFFGRPSDPNQVQEDW